MKSYLAHIVINLKLTSRDRLVLFFNYAFPLGFFFIFAQSFEASQGGAIAQVATMVLILGVLGNGFFGAGMRAVQERELGILRRFKVAPISAAPILVASMVTGWLNYIPAAALIVALSHFVYRMPFPERWFSLFVMLSLAIVSFRSVGLIVASVVNSAQESQILIQLLYLPMLFLSGATFPLTMLPEWLQVVAQFLPATYLYTGLQGIMIRGETLAASWPALAGLAITLGLSTLVSVKLFRWEKEEKVRPAAKLWLAAVLLPFLLLGGWQAYSRENVAKARILLREMSRGRTMLIRDARIFVGDGRVIETGAVLIREGRIERLYEGQPPPAHSLNAEAIEGSGKTVLPGFIDLRVTLSQPGGYRDAPPADPVREIRRALRSYLYCGVTGVRSVGGPPELAALAARDVHSGLRLGAELFAGELDGGWMPMLAAAEAGRSLAAGSAAPLERSLVQQAVPRALIESTKRLLLSRAPSGRAASEPFDPSRELAMGTGSGAPLLPHGPALHRELQLWVEAGVPALKALKAATYDAARRLQAENRIGVIAPGHEATLILVDGNPLEDIAATERISLLVFRGERIARSQMLREE